MGHERNRPISARALYITEVCTSNKNLYHDEIGRFGYDYIEIYNNSNSDAINLKGYGLTDDSKHLNKYIFPSILVYPQCHILVWFSNYRNYNNGLDSYAEEDFLNEDVYEPYAHCNRFSLNANEGIILSDPDGRIVEEMIIPNIPEGKVYGCSINSLDQYVYQDSSPYSFVDNTSIIRELVEDQDIESPTFSVKSGFYNEGFSLEIHSKRGDVFYTLDGSEPSLNSEKYYERIKISNPSSQENKYSNIGGISIFNNYLPNYNVDKCVVVRAISVVGGGKKSKESVGVYFVELDKTIGIDGYPVVSIVTDPDNLFDFEKGIYTVGRVYGDFLRKYKANLIDMMRWRCNYSCKGYGWERAAHIDFFDNEHRFVFGQDLGIRIHGRSSSHGTQKSLNLYAREEYDGNSKILYNFFGKEHRKICLRNGGVYDQYVTKVRDILNQTLVKGRSLGTQDYMPCVVFIDGEYWGLYNLQELIDEQYVDNYYSVGSKNSDIIKAGAVETGSVDAIEDYDKVVDYARNHDLSINSHYQWIERKIDIQSLIDYYCFIIYTAGCDVIKNNNSLWRSKEITLGEEYKDGRWRWLLYDTDDSVGMLSDYTNYKMDSFIEGQYYVSPMSDELFSSLLANDEFKDRFLTSFFDMMNYNFNFNRVDAVLTSLENEYINGVVRSNNRFRGGFEVVYYDEPGEYLGVYTAEKYHEDIGVIRDFFNYRPTYIKNYLFNHMGVSSSTCNLRVTWDNSISEVKCNTIVFSQNECAFEGEYLKDSVITINCRAFAGYEVVGYLVDDKDIIEGSTIDIQMNSDKTVKPIIEKI